MGRDGKKDNDNSGSSSDDEEIEKVQQKDINDGSLDDSLQALVALLQAKENAKQAGMGAEEAKRRKRKKKDRRLRKKGRSLDHWDGFVTVVGVLFGATFIGFALSSDPEKVTEFEDLNLAVTFQVWAFANLLLALALGFFVRNVTALGRFKKPTEDEMCCKRCLKGGYLIGKAGFIGVASSLAYVALGAGLIMLVLSVIFFAKNELTPKEMDTGYVALCLSAFVSVSLIVVIPVLNLLMYCCKD